MIRPVARWALLVSSSVVAASALIILVTVGLLIRGPVEIDYLTPALEAALSDVQPGLQAHIGGARIQFDRDRRRLQLNVADLELLDSDSGAPILHIGLARIDVASRALFRGIIAPIRVVVLAPEIIITREADGSFKIGDLAVGDQAQQGAVGPAAAFEKWLSPNEENRPATFLRELAIDDGTIRLRDGASGELILKAGLDIDVLRNTNGASISARLRPADGGSANLTVKVERDGNAISAQAGLDHIVPAKFAEIAPGLGALGAARLPISGVVSADVDLDLHLKSAAATLSSEGGEVLVNQLYAEAKPIGPLSLDARMTEPKIIELKRLSADLGGPHLTGNGRISLGDAPGFAANLDLDQLDVEELIKFWPPNAAAGGRRWIAKNIPAGRLSAIHAGLDFAPGTLESAVIPSEAVALDFDLDGFQVHYLGELPPLEGARGHAHMTADGLEIGIGAGRSGGLRLDSAHVRLTDFQRSVANAEIEAAIEGSVPESAELLDAKPLGYAKGLGLDPHSLAGSQTSTLRLAFPMIDALARDQLRITAQVKLEGLAVPNVVGARSLSEGAFSAEVTNSALNAVGSAKLSGVPMTIAWNETFKADEGPLRRFQIQASLSDADRERLGIGTAPRLTGTVAARADVSGQSLAADKLSIHAAMDLEKAVVDLPEIGVRETGAGTLAFGVDLSAAGRIKFTDVRLTGPNLAIDGNAVITTDGRLVSLHAAPIKAAKRTDAALDITALDPGYKIDLSGAKFDATALRESLGKAREESGPGPPLKISARLGQALLAKDAPPVEGLVLSANYDGLKTTELTVVGHSPNEGLFRAVISQPVKDTRKMSVTAQNAASVFESLGVFSDGSGGKLAFTATSDDAKPVPSWNGNLAISQMRVAKVRLLVQLLTLASLTGLSDTLEGKGILFQDISGQITAQSGKIYIKDGLAVGPDLCFTVSGLIDSDQDRLDLAGAVVPICSVNSLLGEVPLIGPLIVGRKNEGIIGVDYTLKGSSGTPDIGVNPLSPLAPGFLKKIFDILGGPPKSPPT